MKLIAFAIFAVYLGGIWLFWRGYKQTNFSRQLPTRLTLSLLWPALLVINTNYRQNFRKALKGGD